jgi:hypothetical protein
MATRRMLLQLLVIRMLSSRIAKTVREWIYQPNLPRVHFATKRATEETEDCLMLTNPLRGAAAYWAWEQYSEVVQSSSLYPVAHNGLPCPRLLYVKCMTGINKACNSVR